MILTKWAPTSSKWGYNSIYHITQGLKPQLSICQSIYIYNIYDFYITPFIANHRGPLCMGSSTFFWVDFLPRILWYKPLCWPQHTLDIWDWCVFCWMRVPRGAWDFLFVCGENESTSNKVVWRWIFVANNQGWWKMMIDDDFLMIDDWWWYDDISPPINGISTEFHYGMPY